MIIFDADDEFIVEEIAQYLAVSKYGSGWHTFDDKAKHNWRSTARDFIKIVDRAALRQITNSTKVDALSKICDNQAIKIQRLTILLDKIVEYNEDYYKFKDVLAEVRKEVS